MNDIIRIDDALVNAETGEVVSESLEELAAAINAEHKACEEAAASAVEHAMNCGDYLEQAKASLEHGEWLPWLEANFEGSERHAQRYMKLAANRNALSNPTRVSDLSIRGALRELEDEPSSRFSAQQAAHEEPGNVASEQRLEDVQAELAESGMTLKAVPVDMAEHVGEALNSYRQELSAKEQKQQRVADREAERRRAEEKMESFTLDERVQIVHADFRDALSDIPEQSVDLILTDPPYPAEYVPLYSEIGHMANVTLKPGGMLAVMVGQSYLPDIIERLSEHVTYHWTLAYVTPGGQSPQIWQRKVNTFWKPVLVFVKGEYDGGWFGDVARSDVNDNDKRFHHWGQSESGTLDLMERLSEPGDMVLDPFVGGGTTAIVAAVSHRRFVGCDLSKQAIETTRYRLEEIANEQQ